MAYFNYRNWVKAALIKHKFILFGKTLDLCTHKALYILRQLFFSVKKQNIFRSNGTTITVQNV